MKQDWTVAHHGATIRALNPHNHLATPEFSQTQASSKIVGAATQPLSLLSNSHEHLAICASAQIGVNITRALHHLV